MPLSPETIDALSQALDAVIEEAGDDPQFADLVEQLGQAREAAAGLGDGEDAPPAPEGDEPPADDEGDERDPFSFEDAERAFKEKRKARKAPPAEDDEEAGE